MKFVVAHTGARRSYAVPAILERARMLERFYTDICADVGLGRWIRRASEMGLATESSRRLAGRRLPPELQARTKTFAWPNINHFFRSLPRDPAEAFRREMKWQCALGQEMARAGFGEATWMHAFLAEFPPLVIAAKERGLKVVSEIYILLSADRLLREECRQFPGWERETPDVVQMEKDFFGEHLVITRTDFALCPSQAVQEDIVNNFGFPRAHTLLVPYGVSDRWFEVRNQPVRGRVLFAGAADLRKGIQYLALAAEKLRARGLKYEFRVAGNVQEQVRAQKLCAPLNFLGRVPRDQTAAEFAVADVFVLPSLAEGSAGVTYEALASGVPVVTTPESGSVVRDGVEGRIVPSRDPDALAGAIAEIIEDREKRDRMAHAARERARDYTWERYGERLVGALKGLAR